ncbi:MAG TPA: MarR family transcriptional regulator, partial [Stenomitos sp.]
QATKELRQRESAAIAKVQQLEQSLAALQQSAQQGEILSKFDPLAQLVLEATQATGNLPNPTDGLQTMSIVTRIARAVLRASDEHAAKLGISQTKLAVLMYLSSAPELCASPSELAKHCGVSRAAMTGLLDGLEQDAYVERDSHPSDRRALMIKLTPQGQEFLAWIAPQDQYRLSKLLETFDETERQKLNELAIRLAKLLEG